MTTPTPNGPPVTIGTFSDDAPEDRDARAHFVVFCDTIGGVAVLPDASFGEALALADRWAMIAHETPDADTTATVFLCGDPHRLVYTVNASDTWLAEQMDAVLAAIERGPR